MKLIDWCNSNGEFGAKLIRQYTGISDNNEYYSIDSITQGKRVKLLWKCDVCEHEWFARLDTRVYNKTECPRCKCLERNVSGKKHKKISLYEWCLNNGEFGKQLLDEFTGVDNLGYPINIKEISYGSNKYVHFKCKEEHEWDAQIMNRTHNKTICPICRKKASYDKSLYDWAIENNEYGQQILSEMTLDNVNIKELSYKSAKRFSFTCSTCGYTWKTRLLHRTVYRTGCPMCNRASTSFGEQLIYRYYNKIFKNVHNRIKTTNGYEFDIAIFDVNTCIEYNGELWHSDDNTIKRDNEKRELCHKHNINLITVWQSSKNIRDNNNDICVNNTKVYKNAYEMIMGINKRIGITEIDEDKLKEAMNEAYQYMNYN